MTKQPHLHNNSRYSELLFQHDMLFFFFFGLKVKRCCVFSSRTCEQKLRESLTEFVENFPWNKQTYQNNQAICPSTSYTAFALCFFIHFSMAQRKSHAKSIYRVSLSIMTA